MTTVSQPTDTPSSKVIAGTLGAAVSTVGIWIVEASASIDIPGYVEGAIVTIVTFACGYSKKERAI